MMTSQHAKLLAAHGLTGTFVEAEDIESEDSEIQILRAGKPTGYSVQIGLFGYFHVNQHGGEGDDLWLKLHGEFRSLTAALKHAAKLAAQADPKNHREPPRDADGEPGNVSE